MPRLALVRILGALSAAALASFAGAQQAQESERDLEADAPDAQVHVDPTARAQARERCLAERRVDCDDLPAEGLEPDPGVLVTRPVVPRPIPPRPIPPRP